MEKRSGLVVGVLCPPWGLGGSTAQAAVLFSCLRVLGTSSFGFGGWRVGMTGWRSYHRSARFLHKCYQVG